MSSNKKIAITSAVLILLIIITAASIIAIFAAAQQTVNSEVSVTYKSENVSGTASAKYYVGKADKDGTPMRVNGEAEGETTIEFNSRNEAQAQTLSPVEKEIKLSEENYFVVFEYYFTNTNSQNDFMATLTTSDSNVKNMVVTSTTSETKLENFEDIFTVADNIAELNFIKIIPANKGVYIYVKAEIENLDNDANFTLNFNWDLGQIKETPEKINLDLSGDHYVITQKDENVSGLVVIPNEFNGYPVTEIADSAFCNNDNITGIIIPDNVVEIGEGALAACDNLKNLIIGKGLKPYDYDAYYEASPSFGENSNLTNIYVDKENENCTSRDLSGKERNVLILNSDKALLVGANAPIPDDGSVEIIASCALSGCPKEEIILPETITEIFSFAFEYCTNLTHIEIPNSVVRIYANVFANCKNLKSATIGEGVEHLDYGVFNNCPNLSEIKFNAINCNDLESSFDVFPNEGKAVDMTVIVGDKVERIPAELFEESSLTNLILSPSVKSIGCLAFYNSNLTNFTFYPGITAEGGVFLNTNNLNNVTFKGSADEYLNLDLSFKSELYLGRYNGFNLTTNEGLLTSYEFEEDVPNLAFGYVKSLTSVTFGQNVTTIGENAFVCTGLTSVSIGPNVTTIGDMAFSECYNLNEVIIDSKEICKVLGNNNKDGYLFSDLYNSSGTIKVLNTINATANDHVLSEFTFSGTEDIKGKTYNVYTKK